MGFVNGRPLDGHVVSVAQMRLFLEELEDGDELIQNQVGNLSIVRNGKYIGYVDLGFDRVELFSSGDPGESEQ